MKKFKKLFNLLPAFALAFISGLGVVLDYDQTPKEANAGYYIAPYDDIYHEDGQPASSPNTQDLVVNGIYRSLPNYNFDMSFVDYSYTLRLISDSASLDYTLTVTLDGYTYVTDGTPMQLNINGGSNSFHGVINTNTYTNFRYFVIQPYNAGYNGTNYYISFYLYLRNADFSVMEPLDIRSSFNVSFTLNSGSLSYHGFGSNEIIDYVGVRNQLANYYSSGYSNGYDYGYTLGQNENDYQTGYDEGYSAGWRVGVEQGNDTYYQAGYDYGLSVSEDFYNTAITNADNNGYERGYGVGYEDGVVSQEQNISDAFSDGYAEGYEQGFSADSTAATIFSGILQVGMLPINVLLAIFNFEILGINLSAFISAILTVCLTVIVIRTVTGGKNSE